MASFTWFLFLAPVLPQPQGPLQALLPTALLLGWWAEQSPRSTLLRAADHSPRARGGWGRAGGALSGQPHDTAGGKADFPHSPVWLTQSYTGFKTMLAGSHTRTPDTSPGGLGGPAACSPLHTRSDDKAEPLLCLFKKVSAFLDIDEKYKNGYMP